MKQCKIYIFLVERKRDKERFIMYGSKAKSYGYTHLYNFVNDDYWAKVKTPYGYCCNVSSDIKYDKMDFRIVHQSLYKDAY